MAEDTRNVILFSGHSNYGALNIFSSLTEKSLAKKGYKVYTVNLLDPVTQVYNKMKYLCEKRNIAFSLGFNFMLPFVKEGDLYRIYYDFIDKSIPHVSFMVDSPFYHNDAFDVLGDIRYGFADKEHCGIANALGVRSCFVFQGAIEAEKRYYEKKYDLFFAGSFIDIDAHYNKAKAVNSAEVMRIFDAVFELMRSDFDLSMKAALDAVLRDMDIELLPRDYLRTGCKIVSVDLIMRSLKRKLLVEQLSRTGIRTLLAGRSLKELNKGAASSNITFIDDVPFGEYLSLMAESRIVLNSMPNYSYGSHERVFSAMINKSVCLSDSNRFLKENFTHGEDILFYDFNNLEQIEQSVNSVLKGEDLYNSITQNAYNKVDTNYRWDVTTQKLIELAQ